MTTSAPTNRRVRFPISAKIILWFFVNVVFLVVAGWIFVTTQFGLGLGSLVTEHAGGRLQALAQTVSGDLGHQPTSEWPEVLERFATAYQVQLALYNEDGQLLAGTTTAPPADVLTKIAERGPLPPPPRGPDGPARGRPGEAERPPPPHPAGGPFPKTIMRTGSPELYWVLIRLPFGQPGTPAPRPTTLVLATPSLHDSHLLMDMTPWVLAGVGIFAISALLWLPLIHGITKSLKQMTTAAESIAEGQFQTRVENTRADELGRLAEALNHMAARLREHFTGQKRFLGDIAHELCSPLARMEMALGILDQRADEKQLAYVADVREEVRQMSALVNELLSFSKAAIGSQSVQMKPVPLHELVERVLQREAVSKNEATVTIKGDLLVQAEPELLARAIGNVVRNALRYAAEAGPVEISATAAGDKVILTVSDQGPGVPEATLHRLFDPFFRPEASRVREGGGAGLGLTIVKSCVEACGGTVSVQNTRPRGFRVSLTLQRGSTLDAVA